MKHTIELQPTDTMQRVSRKELCDKFDEWLETVSRDNVGIVITDEGKDDLVLCPSEWFEKLASNNLNRVINGAVINALLNDENQSCYVIGFIKDAMEMLDIKTLITIDHDISMYLDPYGEIHRYHKEWIELQMDVKIQIDKYRKYIDVEEYYKHCVSIRILMDRLKDKKEETYKLVEQTIREIEKGYITDIEGIEDFKYLLMDYGDDSRFYELYKSLREVLKEKHPQLADDKWLKGETK